MAAAAPAETLRIATYAAPLSRDGPGLLLRDLNKGEDDQLNAILDIIAYASPDILVLTDIDYDLDWFGLRAVQEALASRDLSLQHAFTAAPNAGLMTDLDLDNDGKDRTPRDAQGYGRFFGNGGLAVLSRWPLDAEAAQDFTALLWKDLPGATRPEGTPDEVWDIQRLSSTAHWVVPVQTPLGQLDLATWSATPPVFDGPEDRNGLRNRDEARVWSLWLDGAIGNPSNAPVLIGNSNLDPVDGDGLRDTMNALLSHPRLQDPRPTSAGGALAADSTHGGDPALDTADWRDEEPGNLRVSYILPPADWTVLDASVIWPAPSEPLADLVGEAGAHRLVWVDLTR